MSEAMSDLAGEPGPAPTGGFDVVYAGFWRRAAAHVLDHLIILVPLFVAQIMLSYAMGADRPGEDMVAVQFFFFFAYFLVAPLYFAGLESSAAQATPGKRAAGIKVTDIEGRRLGFGQALVRWLASALSYVSLCLGFLMAAFTDRKRALHDYVAATLVVDQWAYTDSPERQPRRMSNGMKLFVGLFLVGMLIVPITLAIAVGQYNHFVQRAQVSEGAVLAYTAKDAIAEYALNNGKLPQSNAEAGLAGPAELQGIYVSYVDIGKRPGRVEVRFSSHAPQRAHEALDGKRLWFDATIDGDTVNWKCHSNELEQKYCPTTCTCGG